MEGYIKLHRQIMRNDFWLSERFTKAQAWTDLLLLATYTERTIFIRGIEISLRPGQLCWSQISLAERWRWNRKTVDKYLQMLKKREMVDTKKDNITTIISIKNWGLYQGNGHQNGQQKDNKTDTNKNVKNGDNEELINVQFQNFWDRYNKKVQKDKTIRLWQKLSNNEREKIFETLQAYIESTPDKKYRKNPDTYLRNKSWDDEIINPDHKEAHVDDY